MGEGSSAYARRVPDPEVLDPAALAARIVGVAEGRRRCLVGIAGPPGAGKSTIAAWLAERLGAPLVPMDGFHLAQAVLDAEGTADRKGAPHTFDAAGFVALLHRLRTPTAGEVVYAPRFDRHLEEPVAGAVAVPPDTAIVVVEGNYLLLDEPPWSEVRALLDLCAHVHVDSGVRVERLVTRHVVHGRSDAEARAWVERSDEPNARLVEACRHRADVLVGPAPWPAG